MAFLGCLALSLTAAASAAAATPPGTITRFSAGLSPASSPQWITAGPDGALWFTGDSAPSIGRITARGVVTDASAGRDLSTRGITVGSDGNLWITVVPGPGQSNPSILKVTPAGAITNFMDGLYGGDELGAITAGPDGNLWFTDGGYAGFSPFTGAPITIAPHIGTITTAGVVSHLLGAPSLLQQKQAGSGRAGAPSGVTVGPDGNVWFSVRGDLAIQATSYTPVGRLTPTGVYTLFDGLQVPGPYSDATSITSGPDGNMWFAIQGAGKGIGRIGPAGGLTTFSGGLGDGVPDQIAAGPDGNLWFTDRGTPPAIGRITPGGAITRFTAGMSPGSQPVGITAGPDGNMWFTDRGNPPAIGVVGTGAAAANTRAPRATGRANVGGKLTCTGDTWSSWAGLQPRRDMFGYDGYRWRRDGIVVSGPPAPTYAPTGRDSGHRISCEVTVTYPLLAVTASAVSAPVVIRPALLALTIAGPKTVTRGRRAVFTYRVRNTTRRTIGGVIVTNTLPAGLAVDRTSRKENLKASKPLRFSGGGRKVTFRVGRIAGGRSVVVRVNARVAPRAGTGAKTNRVVVRGRGIPAAGATTALTIR